MKWFANLPVINKWSKYAIILEPRRFPIKRGRTQFWFDWKISSIIVGRVWFNLVGLEFTAAEKLFHICFDAFNNWSNQTNLTSNYVRELKLPWTIFLNIKFDILFDNNSDLSNIKIPYEFSINYYSFKSNIKCLKYCCSLAIKYPIEVKSSSIKIPFSKNNNY